jgi:hydrogenase maturation protease
MIGYGNPGRGDDGLGPILAERIRDMALPDLEVRSAYHLMVEHAPLVAEADLVVFADAWMRGEGPFRFSEIEAGEADEVSSHGLSPPALLQLSQVLYGRVPRAYLLAVSGVSFDQVKEGLSPVAARNLDLAAAGLVDWLARGPSHA